jgi:shikimate dehydrogenase
MTPEVSVDELGRRCGVVGSPIAHSLSPAIHQAAYEYLGLTDWTYDATRVEEDEFAAHLDGLGPAWRGLSVTMPLKRVALAVAAESSDLASTVGAANTLVRRSDHSWFADNTDVPGAVAALTECGIEHPASVSIWGGGATAASMLAAMAFLDAEATTVYARSEKRARPALAVAAALAHPAEYVAWGPDRVDAESDLVVCTAPAGAIDPIVDIVTGPNTEGRTLFDVVYDPWPTPLAAAWESRGGRVVSGLDLLVHQAHGQVVAMTGSEAPVSVLRDAAERALRQRHAGTDPTPTGSR